MFVAAASGIVGIYFHFTFKCFANITSLFAHTPKHKQTLVESEIRASNERVKYEIECHLFVMLQNGNHRHHQ